MDEKNSIKTTKTSKGRNSSIELLRIILMMQIIFLHVSDYGDYASNAIWIEGRTELAFWFIWLLCRCPVYLFIVITGYFMSGSTKDFNGRRFLKCYLPMLFYSISIPVLYGAARPGSLTNIDYIRGFFPILSRTWYFMTLYVLILVLSPYLNRMVKGLSKKEFLILIGICFFVFSIWQPFSQLEPFKQVVGISKIISTQKGKSLYDFIYMYLLGAFMRKYHFLSDSKNKNLRLNNPILYLGLFLALGIIDVILVYNYPDNNIVKTIGYNDNPLVVLQCITLFRFFEKLDLSKFEKLGTVINYISAGNLGIYMIHEHPLIRSLIWNELVDMDNLEFYAKGHYFFKIFLIIIIIYAACWTLDWIRRMIWKGIVIVYRKSANIE